MKYLAVVGLAAAIALPMVLGCGGAGTAETAKVTGTVTYKGTPLDNVSVAFIPQGAGGRPATGLTDANGRFTLSTFKTGDGAIPGTHKVVVSEASASDPSKLPPMPGMPGYVPPERAKKKTRFPAKYSAETTTTLEVTVERGKANDIPIELKD